MSYGSAIRLHPGSEDCLKGSHRYHFLQTYHLIDTHSVDLRGVVGDQQHCAPLAPSACLVDRGRLCLLVQPFERLVKKKDIIVGHQCPQERHPPSHSAGEFPTGLFFTAAQTNGLHGREHLLLIEGWSNQPNIGYRRERITQPVLLEYRAFPQSVQPVDLSAVLPLQPHQDVQYYATSN